MAMETMIDYSDALDAVKDLVNTYFNPMHEIIPTIDDGDFFLFYNVSTVDDYELLRSNEEVLDQIINSVLPDEFIACGINYYPMESFVKHIRKVLGGLQNVYSQLCREEDGTYYISIFVHDIDEMLTIYDNIEKIDDLYDKLITDDRIDGYEIIFNL